MKKNKNQSRTVNAIRNSAFGIFSKFGILILQFICRTIFIKKLGSEYLGLNGLFTNILTILSFTELGLGEAIIYNMYKPIAFKDNEKISKLLRLYRKCYRIITLVILSLGIFCIPFLKSLIGKTPDIKESIYLIYILFLIQSVTSYFLTYRRSLISANQNDYICSNADLFSEFIASTLKIIVLIVFKNYILFLLIQISRNIIANTILYVKSKKMYPEIDENKVEDVNKEERKSIFSNVKALVVYKFSSTINSGTDNIIITKLVNLKSVGIISNYSLLVGALDQILLKIMLSFTAGIGNLNAKDNVENREKVFYTLNFVVSLIYGFSSIMLIVFLNHFVGIWLGDKFTVTLPIIIALCLDFYTRGVQYAGYNYSVTTSVFKKSKWSALASAILNIILSIILGIKFGIFGIILATSISRILTQNWIEPYLIFKDEFKKSSKKIFYQKLRNVILITINLLICLKAVSYIKITNIVTLILSALLIAILCILIFILEFFYTTEFKDLLNRVKYLFIKES